VTVSTKDIAWLAGLLEGEGCFRFDSKAHLVIQLAMTDRDVVDRAAALLGGAVCEKKPKAAHHKMQYLVRVFGARAAGWMMTFWPFLGQRRRQKVEDCLSRWRMVPTRTEAARSNVKKAQKAAATYWARRSPEEVKAHCAKMRAARVDARRDNQPIAAPAAA